jgi:alpha-tubulin suppressor-like RCC1 family protein
VDDDGVVGSKGCGAYGMLGHADAEDRLQLTVIEALRGRPVVQVSAGAGHGMVLLADGTLVTYGEGHQGCLGHGNIQDRYIDENVPPTTVAALRGTTVAQISAGASHSVVLLRGGQVMTFGYGANGCLGHGNARDRWLPTAVGALQGCVALQISAGSSHSMVLLDDARVMTFGLGKHGLLGHGDERTRMLPKVVDALQTAQVLQVSAGGLHSMVLLADGGVMTFGHGASGSLGHGDEHSRWLPAIVGALEGREALQISAGTSHSAVMLAGGEVLTFGYGRNMRLGHGNSDNQFLPRTIDSLWGTRVVEVLASRAQTVVLTEAGQLVVFHAMDSTADWVDDGDGLGWEDVALRPPGGGAREVD